MKKNAMLGIATIALLGMLALGFTAAVSASTEDTATYSQCHGMENAPDADGDGIPNGMDTDFERPMNGTGMMHHYGGAGGHGQMNGECNGEGKMYRHAYRYQMENQAEAP